MHLIVILILYWLWPFHKNHPTPQPQVIINPQMENEPTIPERLCGHTPEIGWDFVGPDGMVGVSTISCQEAFRNWNAKKSSPPL